MAQDIQATIEGALRRALQPTPIQAIEILQGHDHADEDALFIVVELAPSTPLIGGKKYLAAMTGVSDALLAMGDRRLPYIRLRHLGGEGVDEGESEGIADR